MILDRLTNADRYASLHPLFPAAFAWLRQAKFTKLADGRYEIDGDRLFVILATGEGKEWEGANLEVHRRYIDIQYSIKGTDSIGWEVLDKCETKHGRFIVAKDIGFFVDAPATWFDLAKGTFAIFFPEDAHAPMAGIGTIRKAVVKIQVA